MPFTSSYISQQIHAQQAMASGQMAYAQQLSYPMQQAMQAGAPMPPPPPMAPPPMTAMQGLQGAHGGMYGEQVAMGMAGVGRTAWGVGSAVGGLAMDPVGLGIGAAMAGGGLAGGLAVGGAVALPMYAAGRVADHYGGAFMGGMQQQASINSTLRGNFNFFGGQGRMGRGFNQEQMGQIGQVLQNELNTNAFTNTGELNQLISGGAEAGMFTGVRDVQQFTQRFRRMLDTLKSVQDELGGTLTEALRFVRQSRQSGIFQEVDRVNFAGEMRSAEATTGLSREQLMGLSTQGAQISRSVGGLGRQGAYGALRAASTLGGAVQSGVINEEALSEATGGLTGADAIGAFTTRMLQRSARFSRRGMGRYTIYGMSNEDGTGLDQDMLNRLMSGDMTTGEISRRAHRNVGRMGRARAINQEGHLRGALLEQGGMAGQLGMFRQMVGDRALDQGDDIASLVLQRRFRMSRPESEVMLGLLRNQGTIAQQQRFDSMGAERQQNLQTDLRENRSLDAFTRHLSHGMQQATGTRDVEAMGRRFMTRISSLVERAMNDVLGVAENAMSTEDRAAMNRMMIGRASDSDMERLSISPGMSGSPDIDPRGGLFERAMGRSPGDILRRRGDRGTGSIRDRMRRAVLAREGTVTGDDALALENLNKNVGATRESILNAQIAARGSGNASNIYQYLGGNANAIDAFMNEQGMQGAGVGFNRGSLMMRGGGRLNNQNVGRDLTRMAMSPALMLAQLGMGAGMRSQLGFMESDVMGALANPQERMADFYAGGGEMGQRLRQAGVRTRGETRMRRTALGLAGHAVGRLSPELARRMGIDDQGYASDVLGGLQSDRESVMALAGSEQFRRRADRILSAEGSGALGEELDAFSEEISRMEDPGQRAAANALRYNLRKSMGRGGGRLTDEARQRLQALRTDPERQQQIIDQRRDISRTYLGISRRLAGMEGGAELSVLSGVAGAAFSGTGDPREATNAMINRFAQLDPESAQAQRLMTAAGDQEGGEAFMGEVARRRQLFRDLSGRGRRGRRGRAAAGLGLITGNQIGGMDIRLNGRRLRSPAQIESIIARGGEDAQSVLNQISTGLGADEETRNLIQSYGSAMQSGRGLDREEQEELVNRAGQNDQLQRIQREAVERQQRQQNPLDTTRNEHLQNINRGIQQLVDAAKEGGTGTGEAE